MTLDETAKVIDILQLNYPDSFKGKTDEEAVGTIKLWQAVLSGDSYSEVQAAVLAYVASDTGRFMPPVGAIKQKLIAIRNHKSDMTEAEAWNIVMRAIRNGTYGASEEFEKMPPICQRLVGSPKQLKEWATDPEFNFAVVQSNFMRSYKVLKEQEKEFASLPAAARKVFGIAEQVAQKMIRG